MTQTKLPHSEATVFDPALYASNADNDWLLTPADFLTLNEYPSAGQYLNDCLDKTDTERTHGTLALCHNSCLLLPGQATCPHGCPAAADYFEAQAESEGDQ